MTDKLSSLYKKAQELNSFLLEHRRYLHQHPELSFCERHTHRYISSLLNSFGIPHTSVAETGIVAIIGYGERCVALRADIDALPIKEQAELPFRSLHDGVMHACGHDCHTAMLLGAAVILHQEHLPGRVILIFQPGEEKSPGGASLIIKEGILDEFKPEAIFGQHVYPDAVTGTIALSSGPIMASADELYWTLRGKSAHVAQPHKGANPLRAAAELIMHLEGLAQTTRNPIQPALLSITAIEGGTATNIIPEYTTMKGTLRSFDSTWRQHMWNRILTHSQLLCSMHDVQCNITIDKGYPPLVNNPDTTTFVHNVAQCLLGSRMVIDFEPKLWAEDFAFYAEKIPATFWMLGCRPADLAAMPGLHSPLFSPDENALPIGTAMLCAVAMEWLSSKNHTEDLDSVM